ncbi:hypothetical protein Goshw_020959 [Gossypium schwendimanii]|uniref:RNase H type-1 domain-containing protein n=1 Tax=Gossypium schwendimanii TaxID=34291 RepID=A0A7J9N4S3_GOSSC|nr:hypothetical protein [Gossypium schwendimanii]
MSGMFWCPLRYGWVNFNVSRVANEDEVECEGLLRDSNGVAMALFLGPVAAKDSITTKAGEIIIALDVLKSWMLQSIFKDIKNIMVRVGDVSFSKFEKHGNEMAYALELAGIKRLGMFKAWW